MALSLSAFAQTSPQPTSKGSTGSDAMPATQTARSSRQSGCGDKFHAADTNGDGKLSRSEAQKMPMLAKHFDEIDANKDGFVTCDELRAWRQKTRAAAEQGSGQKSGKSAASPPGSGNDGSH
ncbi:MAG TPA: hypothetical protein VK660_07745 [Xanthomonadaceae bacterium]|nr:hypothetical protein [Xanthomonadaceae bacterium]